MKLSVDDQTRIEEAVAAAEARTSAEFALAVAQAADRYAAYPMLWAALAALLTGGAIAIVHPAIGIGVAFAIQAVVFVCAGIMLHLPALRPRLAPAAVRREEAAKLARLQFAALVQRRTESRAGLLLFVSLAEHHIEILVDRTIDERIPEAAWRAIIDGFAARIRQGKLADGFIEAVGRCTDLLEREFPILPGDKDELPNRVTLI
jgi:putative membrane protein